MKPKRPKKDPSAGKEPPVIQLSRRRAAGWVCVFLFITVWVFLLGIIVGRGMSPVRFDMKRIGRDWSDPKAVAKKIPAPIKMPSAELPQRSEFEFHKKLKEKQTYATNPEDGVLEKTEADPPVETVKKLRSLKRLSKKDGGKPPETDIKAASAPDDSPAGAYTIQIASMQDKDAADQLVSKLRRQGHTAFKSMGRLSNNQVWYRIRIGGFQTKSDAEQQLREIKKKHAGAILVKR